MQQKTNVCGVISLTLSIISFILSVCSCIGLPLAFASLILGIVGMCKKNMPTGTAIAGLIISIFSLLFGTGFFIMYFIMGESANLMLESLS